MNIKHLGAGVTAAAAALVCLTAPAATAHDGPPAAGQALAPVQDGLLTTVDTTLVPNDILRHAHPTTPHQQPNGGPAMTDKDTAPTGSDTTPEADAPGAPTPRLDLGQGLTEQPLESGTPASVIAGVTGLAGTQPKTGTE
ncbi:hypothetical protein [Streptomyces sp. NPDC051546]|uniref:hypothetical protein n=1 Tax=Streptomyces sp. NPDC051546 TaxID=3365655 RepID=UPI0037B423F0